jgi:hypothetical protein
MTTITAETILNEGLNIFFIGDESDSFIKTQFLHFGKSKKNIFLANANSDILKGLNTKTKILITVFAGGVLKQVDVVPNPSPKADWIEAVNTFVDNFENPELDGDYWKAGQIVQEDGEYLCKDCGLVLEFAKGDYFPICDACQAGEPDGPSTPEQGFWELI